MSASETALIAAAVSAVVAMTVSYLTRRSQERAALETRIVKALELAMSYPHVEDPEYCDKWGSPLAAPAASATKAEKERYEEEHDKRLQYEMYCCFVFNLVEGIWRYCWFERGVPKILHVEEFVETHRCWWEGQKDNLFGYSLKFQGYVNRMITQIKQREARK